MPIRSSRRVLPHVPKGDVTQPLIVAVALEEDEPKPLSREELEGWRQELKKMALRFREGLERVLKGLHYSKCGGLACLR